MKFKQEKFTQNENGHLLPTNEGEQIMSEFFGESGGEMFLNINLIIIIQIIILIILKYIYYTGEYI